MNKEFTTEINYHRGGEAPHPKMGENAILNSESIEKSDPLSHAIIGAAIEVHKFLGPGLLESTYENCLIHELHLRKLKTEQQKPLPILYKQTKLDCGYRIDLVVENQIIIEIKSVNEILPIHEAQVITYLKLSNCRKGLLINFNVKILKNGIRRIKI